MNQMSYAEVHHPHMTAGQAHVSSSGPPTSIAHYPQYSQPTMMQGGPPNYSAPQSSYAHYSYGPPVGQPPSNNHAVSSSMNSAMVPQHLPLPSMAPAASSNNSQGYQSHTFDTTGQVAPPGMKPRLTATLWEDEGSLCFQVEAKGVCVARREDNHMINGTKLLNVAGMTRGRRDGILKSEKLRHVVKIGPMHLKGVWIPFERALEFANKEKITEHLYPLFVHDIGALLYHPSNQSRSSGTANAAMAAAERRRAEQRMLTAPAPSLPSSIPQAAGHVNNHVQHSPHAISHQQSVGRPTLDRAHTFPTPPASASSVIGINNHGNPYEWGNSNVAMQNNQPLSIDTGLSNSRSVPNTPATTPPGSAMHNAQQYQTSQPYDASRPLYAQSAPQQAQYASQTNMNRYGQPLSANSYLKHEMAPPARTTQDSDQQQQGSQAQQQQPSDSKPRETSMNQAPEQATHEEEVEQEAESDYQNANSQYAQNRGHYNFNGNGTSAPLHNEPSQVSSELNESPSRPNGSGRATPRAAQSQWPGTFNPARTQQPSGSSLYSVISESRPGGTNGAAASDAYPPPSLMASPFPPGSTYAVANGGPLSGKRAREVDDDEVEHYGRPSSRGEDGEFKRRKTLPDEASAGGAVGGTSYDQDGPRTVNRPRATPAQRRR